MNIHDAIAAVGDAHLDPGVHESLGDVWAGMGRPIHAVAVYRTAVALNGDGPDLPRKLAAATAACPTPLADLDHNRYARMRTLATALRELAGRDDFSLLDVGGGDGALSLFLPDTAYMLAEPATNGISGERLPFAEGAADLVCACHVLEHVPADARFDFLDALRSRARGHLVLLNPFLAAGAAFEERMGILIDTTGAPWAKEHLECGLPELALVEEYAENRGIEIDVRPDGAITTGFLSTLATHYAGLAGRAHELTRVHRYLNTLDPHAVTNPRLPGGYLVTMPGCGSA